MFLDDKLNSNTFSQQNSLHFFKVFRAHKGQYLTDLFDLYSMQTSSLYNIKNNKTKNIIFHKEHEMILVENGISRFLSSSINFVVLSSINDKRLRLLFKLT